MKIAFEVMKRRQTVNPITSIFVLTDGVETSKDPFGDITRSLNLSGVKDQNFTISCFGFGADHDEQLLLKVANLKDGNFYFIEKLDTVDEAFADALGGLMSIVAFDAQISVKNIAPEPFNQIRIKKTFGNKWQKVGHSNDY
jgi:hypothetical protein